MTKIVHKLPIRCMYLGFRFKRIYSSMYSFPHWSAMHCIYTVFGLVCGMCNTHNEHSAHQNENNSTNIKHIKVYVQNYENGKYEKLTHTQNVCRNSKNPCFFWIFEIFSVRQKATAATSTATAKSMFKSKWFWFRIIFQIQNMKIY